VYQLSFVQSRLPRERAVTEWTRTGQLLVDSGSAQPKLSRQVADPPSHTAQGDGHLNLNAVIDRMLAACPSSVLASSKAFLMEGKLRCRD